MEIGTGIVVATFTLVAAWQLEKRQGWRKFGLALGGLGMLAVLGVGVMYANSTYQEHQAKAEAVAEVAAIRNGTKADLAGLTLGQTRNEVEYIWGTPTREENGWPIWEVGDDYRTAVFSESGGTRVIVRMGVGYSTHCGSVAGISVGDSEAAVLNSLGAPVKAPEYSGTRKSMSYGPQSQSLDVVLAAGRVTGFVLVRNRKKT